MVEQPPQQMQKEQQEKQEIEQAQQWGLQHLQQGANAEPPGSIAATVTNPWAPFPAI